MLQVRDGPTRHSPQLARLCGYVLPNPIFSTGNALLLLLSGDQLNYNHLDITYTTTDQGISISFPAHLHTVIHSHKGKSYSYPRNYAQHHEGI